MPTMPKSYTNLPPANVLVAAEQIKTTRRSKVNELLGADPDAANVNVPEIHSSLARFNAIQADKAKNIVGYTTFMGSVSENDDGTGRIQKIYNVAHSGFISANGEPRLFQRFISEPIYYAKDKEHFEALAMRDGDSWLFTPKPLNSRFLQNRGKLAEKSFDELLTMAKRNYPNAIKAPDTMLKEELVDALLKIQYPNREA